MWNRRSDELSRSLTVLGSSYVESRLGIRRVFSRNLRHVFQESRKNWSESEKVEELRLSGWVVRVWDVVKEKLWSWIEEAAVTLSHNRLVKVGLGLIDTSSTCGSSERALENNIAAASCTLRQEAALWRIRVVMPQRRTYRVKKWTKVNS